MIPKDQQEEHDQSYSCSCNPSAAPGLTGDSIGHSIAKRSRRRARCDEMICISATEAEALGTPTEAASEAPTGSEWFVLFDCHVLFVAQQIRERKVPKHAINTAISVSTHLCSSLRIYEIVTFRQIFLQDERSSPRFHENTSLRAQKIAHRSIG